MGLFNILKKKNKSQHSKDEVYMALDIGTEMIKGLLFKVSDMGVEIISSYYVKQPVKAMQAGRVLDTELVIKGADHVINGLFEQINQPRIPNIKSIFGIAGELINGISISANINRMQAANTKIDENEESKILNSLFDQIIHAGKQELAYTLGTQPDKVMVLNVSMNGAYIDGLPVSRLLGQKGSRINGFLYASFAPVDIIAQIAKITHALRIKLNGIVVQPYAVARSFNLYTNPDASGIFIDIGGGTTDVALVLEGFNIQTKMFAFGGRAFTNRLVKQFNLDYNLAEERKIKYSSGSLPKDIGLQVKSALKQDVRLWVEAVKTALSKMEGVEKFPDTIYLCGGGALLPDIQDALVVYPWENLLPFEKHPKVYLTTPSKQDRVYDRTGKLLYPYDVTPVALARFLYDIIENPKYNYVGFENEG